MQHADFLVVVCRLLVAACMWDLVPRPGIEPGHPASGARSLDRQGSPNEEHLSRASLVAQWLRIRMPMQGTRVQTLVQEDPTCRGAAKLVRDNN